MNTYIIISNTDYGDDIYIVNAFTEEAVKQIAYENGACGDSLIELINTSKQGIVFRG